MYTSSFQNAREEYIVHIKLMNVPPILNCNCYDFFDCHIFNNWAEA